MKGLYGSAVFALVALVAAGVLGWVETSSAALALQMAFEAAVLGVMETSLSLDNAVVNSSLLKRMDPVWGRRFTTWGMLVAVVGMRLFFPVVIVAVAGRVGLLEAARIAVTQHDRYEAIVTGAHVGIAGFGGTFLLLIGTHFFVDGDREHLWIPHIERPLSAISRVPLMAYILTVCTVVALSFALQGHDRTTFLIAAAAGLACFLAVEKIGDLVGDEDALAGRVATGGLVAFVQLELLDASFSFDGVIGAFAITNDILLIAIGLGIGAMFVRSMTLALVRGGALDEYRFLEPGAFYAIAALSIIMLAGPVFETPQFVTGLLGAAFIGAALYSSIRHRRLHPEEYAADGDAAMITPLGDVIPTPGG